MPTWKTSLKLMHLATILFLGVISLPSVAQLPDWESRAGEKLSFEVATIKPNKSDIEPQVNFTLGPGDAYKENGGRMLTTNIGLLDYIRFAYKLSDGQTGILQKSAPVWITSERFDIQAKSENPDPTKDQMRLMMQSLLADRFGLRVHSETQQLDVLALVLIKAGKLGPQLRPHSPGDETCAKVSASSGSNESANAIPKVCGALVAAGEPNAPSRVRIGGRKVPLALLAAHLGQMGDFDRPVVDQTGLSGTFDLALEWGPDATDPPHDEGGRQIYMLNALKDQLGLKLERRKSPFGVILIDHIDPQPTDN